MTARLVDLSHTITHGMTTYPGLPGPLICDYLSREASRGRYAPGVEFQIGKIEMVANTGTYVDAPFHRYADGADLSALSLDALADLDAVVVRAPGGTRAVDVAALRGVDVGGRAVLVHTGWDVHWGTERYLSDNPFVTAEAAEHLRREGAVLVGIDSLNIDSSGRRRASGPLDPARGGNPHRGAPHRPGRRARPRLPLLGRAGQGRGVRHLAGAGLR